jgi:thiol-disulfide isomerase/thioredoxin
MKRRTITGNILYAVLMIIVFITIINPKAKSLLIRGLMSVGLFQPHIPDTTAKQSPGPSSHIRFRDTTGRIINISELKGKVIFVNFWATWCPPCIAEMPSVNQLYTRFKNDTRIVFIFVDVDNDYSKVKSFQQKNNYHLPIYTQASQIPDSLMDGTIPTTLMFDKNGSLIYQHSGAADYSSSKFQDFLSSISK